MSVKLVYTPTQIAQKNADRAEEIAKKLFKDLICKASVSDDSFASVEIVVMRPPVETEIVTFGLLGTKKVSKELRSKTIAKVDINTYDETNNAKIWGTREENFAVIVFLRQISEAWLNKTGAQREIQIDYVIEDQH